MKRRALLKTTAAVAASSAISAPAFAQGKREFKVVTSWPKNFPGLGTTVERLSKRLSDATQGQYSMKIYAGGELVHPLECHDAVQQGNADMYHSADYYYTGKQKSYAFFCAAPFGLLPNEHNAWLYHGGGQALWDEIGAQFNIKHFAVGNAGSQMGGWFKNPINELDDLKGLKMRIPGLGGEVLKKLGATPVTLAGAEILPALQSGSIDAAEWVSPWNDLAFGFYKIVKNYYPGFQEPNSSLTLGINRDVWDELPLEIQHTIEHIAMAEQSFNLAEFNANNTIALKTLVEDHGVILHDFNDDIYQAMAMASQEVYQEVAASSALDKKVVDSYTEFRNKVTGWTELSTQSFINKRAQYPFV